MGQRIQTVNLHRGEIETANFLLKRNFTPSSPIAPRLRSVSDSVLHSFDSEVWSKDSAVEDKKGTGNRSLVSCLALLLAGAAVAGR